jgi:hypothetical protein
MRYISLIFISFFIISCRNEAIYEAITKDEYSTLNPRDTIINTFKLLVTCTGSADHFNDMETILVRKYNAYYKLAPDVYFTDGSTMIQYQGFFSSGGDNGPFQENGIWVYTDFYRDTFQSGMRYAVDSMPPGYKDSSRPKKEGIYFYEKNKLRRIASGQSEEEFKEFGKNGFYFIPNSGRFFKRHNASILH